MVNKRVNKKVSYEEKKVRVVCSACGLDIAHKDCNCQASKPKNGPPLVGWKILEEGA